MANVTDPLARAIHGTNPQNLMEYITRQRIYDSRYWKEDCFGLSAQDVAAKAATSVTCIGGTFGGNNQPCPFLCLVLKLLQIQPSDEVVEEMLSNEDFHYVRALGAFYLRLSGVPATIYEKLELSLTDYRRLKCRRSDGSWSVVHMDEYMDALLHEDRYLGMALPRLPLRTTLEEAGYLTPRRSALEPLLAEAANVVAEDQDNHDGWANTPAEVLLRRLAHPPSSSSDPSPANRAALDAWNERVQRKQKLAQEDEERRKAIAQAKEETSHSRRDNRYTDNYNDDSRRRPRRGSDREHDDDDDDDDDYRKRRNHHHGDRGLEHHNRQRHLPRSNREKDEEEDHDRRRGRYDRRYPEDNRGTDHRRVRSLDRRRHDEAEDEYDDQRRNGGGGGRRGRRREGGDYSRQEEEDDGRYRRDDRRGDHRHDELTSSSRRDSQRRHEEATPTTNRRKRAKKEGEDRYGTLFKKSSSSSGGRGYSISKGATDNQKHATDTNQKSSSSNEQGEGSVDYWNEQRAKLGLKPLRDDEQQK